MPKAKSGNALPSPRLLSNTLFVDTQKYNDVLSNMAAFWGQFVAHDLSLRIMEQCGGICFFNHYILCLKMSNQILHIKKETGGIQCCTREGCFEVDPNNRPSACAPIIVSPNDPFYSNKGIRCLNFVRSITAPTVDNTLGPAQQVYICFQIQNMVYT